ncbi:hypothetical protein Dimus_037215 [Dionaea muscipula]
MDTKIKYREIHGVKIWKAASESKLAEMEVLTKWKKYESPPATIPWTFDSGKETMYFIKGKVKVSCKGHDGYFEIGTGDLVEFPRGMTIVFDIVDDLEKRFLVEKE